MKRYTYIWEFLVKPGHESDFLKHYGPDGSWSQIFRQAPGFIETLLLKDRAAPLRYVTIDRWASAAAFQAFRAQFARQYAELDKVCEGLTASETELGTFDG